MVNLTGQLRLARACGAHQEQRFLGRQGDALHAFDECVKGFVARGDALLEEGVMLLLVLCAAHAQAVVLGQVQVDDRVAADGARVALRRRRSLQQTPAQALGLDQQEQADLGRVRACGDMHEAVFLIPIDGSRARPIVERRIHLGKVPRVVYRQACQSHLRVRRLSLQVRQHLLLELGVLSCGQQLQARDR